MRHGEKVVSAVSFEGKVLVFGEWGSVEEITRDELNGCYVKRTILER